MKNNLETNLTSYYDQFSVGHEQRRSQLLRSLPAVQHRHRQELALSGGRGGMGQAWKSAAALAAGLMIVVGAIFYAWPQDATTDTNTGSGIASVNLLSAKEAYAAAIDRVTKVESLHFIWTTPNSGRGASVEMWWRHPNDYRMEFVGDGLIMAGNEDRHYSYDPSKEELKIWEGAGLYRFPLEQLGRLFSNEDDQLTKQWIEESKIIRSEPIDYKGEKCLKVICVHQISQERYEYIIDAQVGMDTRIPFYEVKQYSQPEGGRLMSHVEVLEVNKDYADSLFTVE